MDFLPSRLTLRPYQQQVADEVTALLAANPNGRVMVQMPTGAGKTELVAYLLADALAGLPTCFIPHRQELVGQTVRRFQSYGLPALAGSATGSHGLPNHWRAGKRQPDGVMVLGVETYLRRLAKGQTDTAGLLVLDEAHTTGGNARRQRLFRKHTGPLVALTATPIRTARGEGFDALCDYLVVGADTGQLITDGYLADYLCRNSVQAVRTMLAGQRAGESDSQWAVRTFRSGEVQGALTQQAVRIWASEPLRQADSKTLAFGISIPHAERLLGLFTGIGVNAVMLHGGQSRSDRAAVMDAFARPNADGGAAVLINVDMVREGFDCPEADILLCCRPTKSLALWLQMCGRVLRVKPDGRKAVILDLPENATDLGLPSIRRNWSLTAKYDAPPTGVCECDDDDECACGLGPAIRCAGQVVLDLDGYVVRGTGNTFDGGKGGCQTLSPAGSYQCKGCGAAFRRQCPAQPDGCGKWRTAKRWSGDYRVHRLGYCDPCGEESAVLSDVALLRLRWRRARSGNGQTLGLAGRRVIWVGKRRTGNTAALLGNADDMPPELVALADALAALPPTLSEWALQDEAVKLLSAAYADAGDDAAPGMFGVLCRHCQQAFHDAAYISCWDCGQRGVQVGMAPAVVAGDAPPPAPAATYSGACRRCGNLWCDGKSCPAVRIGDGPLF